VPSTNPILTLLLQTNLSGRWTNELGSKVELEFHKDGRVSGKYHTAVGDDHTWEPVHGMLYLPSFNSFVKFMLDIAFLQAHLPKIRSKEHMQLGLL